MNDSLWENTCTGEVSDSYEPWNKKSAYFFSAQFIFKHQNITCQKNKYKWINKIFVLTLEIDDILPLISIYYYGK